jgi:hypothetical protein
MMPAGTHARILNARPQPIEIDRVRRAVLAMEMQNEFGTRGGVFDRTGDETGRPIGIEVELRIAIGGSKAGFRPAFEASSPGPMLVGVCSAGEESNGRL